MLLLDTSVLIAAEHDRLVGPDVGDGDDLAISTITIFEYRKGIEAASREPLRARRRLFLQRTLSWTTVIDVDRAVACQAARVWDGLRRDGITFPVLDLMIAATALQRNWPLVTADIRDFRRIPELRLIELAA